MLVTKVLHTRLGDFFDVLVGDIPFFVLVGAVVIEWHRLRELIPAAMIGTLFTGMHGALPLFSARVHYIGSGPVTDQWAIILLIQTSMAPVLTAWYAQGITSGRGFPFMRTAIFTTMSVCFALMSIHAGALAHIAQPLSWVLGNALLFILTWKVHTYASRPVHETPSSRVR